MATNDKKWERIMFCGHWGKLAGKGDKKPLKIAAAVLLTLAVCAGGFNLIRQLSGPSAGDIIEFGGHEWRVLEKRGGRVLVITEYVIAIESYHDTSEHITWKDSEIRSYLNGEFYDRFPPDERNRIARTQIINANNPWYETDGGRGTVDRVFLLSIDEVVKYFGDSGILKNRPSDDVHVIDDVYNPERATILRRGSFEDGRVSRWWTRSPGITPYGAAFVADDGVIYFPGVNVFFMRGVRPALWLKL